MPYFRSLWLYWPIPRTKNLKMSIFSQYSAHYTRTHPLPDFHKVLRYMHIADLCHVLIWRKSVVTNTTTTVLRPFVRDYTGELVPEETLTHPRSWSSSILYRLLPSAMIHNILLVQITCLAIFLHNHFPCPLWSTSWSGALHLIFHTFLHPISVFFSQHMPIPSQLFCCSINIISSIPSLSLNSLELCLLP